MAVLAATILLGGGVAAALLYANRDGGGKESAASGLSIHARGTLAKMQTPEPFAAPDYVFKDVEGGDVRFADFAGKVVVVNLWATWCAPCKLEMPTLAALATAYEGQADMLVLPISVDVGDTAVAEARAFIGENAPLPYFADPRFQLPFEFPGKGAMPQTILLDRRGQVRAVMIGEADWAGAEARALIDALLTEEA